MNNNRYKISNIEMYVSASNKIDALEKIKKYLKKVNLGITNNIDVMNLGSKTKVEKLPF